MKRKLLLVILVFITCVFTLSAQQYEWAFRLGNTSPDYGNAIVCDASGNIYITGRISGLAVDFDPGPGVANGGNLSNHMFVAKYDAGGNYLWANRFGISASQEEGLGIELDAMNNVIITGKFEGTVDFDPGPGVLNLTSTGAGSDVYVVKYDLSGNFLWAISIGGQMAFDFGNCVTTDPNNNIYISGIFYGTADFDPGTGVSNLVSQGESDIFIAKYDPSGNYLWAYSIGGPESDFGNSITLNASGEILITGLFQETVDFDPGAGTSNITATSSYGDMFITKYDAAGNFIWAINTQGFTIGNSIITDASDNIFVTGDYQGLVDFDPGSGVVNLINSSNGDVFLAKYGSSGNLIWVHGFNSPTVESGSDVIIDNFNNLYFSGYFSDTMDFDPDTSIVANLIGNGGEDLFISRFTTDGDFVWAIGAGSETPDGCNSIAAGPTGDIYGLGSFTDTVDFDPGIGVVNLINSSTTNSDLFVAKYSQIGIGVEETIENNFKIYPNPFSDEINIISEAIYSEKKHLEIFDSNGKVIQAREINANKTTINTSDFAYGIYLMKITNGSEIMTAKVIKF